jgi:nucleotidyltransferase substrate binding protein (TIGR01987 family)
MSRFDERKKDYNSALLRLEEALEVEQNEIVIDGVLHRFEFTFELAWKTIKDYMEYMGISEGVGSPRENIKLAFKQEIISDGELWIEIMLARNSLSHLYDEEESRKIYENIKNKYIYAFKELREKFENLL